MQKKHLIGLAAVAAVGALAYMAKKNATATADGSVKPIDTILTTPKTGSGVTLPPGLVGFDDGPNFAPIPQPAKQTVKTLPAGLIGHSDGAGFAPWAGWGGPNGENFAS